MQRVSLPKPPAVVISTQLRTGQAQKKTKQEGPHGPGCCLCHHVSWEVGASLIPRAGPAAKSLLLPQQGSVRALAPSLPSPHGTLCRVRTPADLSTGHMLQSEKKFNAHLFQRVFGNCTDTQQNQGAACNSSLDSLGCYSHPFFQIYANLLPFYQK